MITSGFDDQLYPLMDVNDRFVDVKPAPVDVEGRDDA